MDERIAGVEPVCIQVIGVGGGNAVEHLISRGVKGVVFICANTNAQALSRSSAGRLVQLGASGLGAGSKPEVGRRAAEQAVDRIRDAIEGSHLLFITAGMGGGTGTGAAPVIARLAREMGILTVGVATKPFEFEGRRRGRQAEEGIAQLEADVDRLIVVLNERLLEVLGDEVSLELAFAHADDVLKSAVGGIGEIIHVPGLVNVDSEDVRTVMSAPGMATMGTARAAGPDRATQAAERALARPLLEGIDLSAAQGLLVLIAASRRTFRLAESRNAMNALRRCAKDDTHVIYGAAYDESSGDELRVTVIATGLGRPQAATVMPHGVTVTAAPSLRSGVDHAPLPPAPEVSPVHDCGKLDTPSVWRHSRGEAATWEALGGSSMDAVEFPAFLRRRAVDPHATWPDARAPGPEA